MGLYRYYTIMRPPMPGAIPPKCVGVCTFDKRMYIEEIGRYAWGFVEYSSPLSAKDIADYELEIMVGKGE